MKVRVHGFEWEITHGSTVREFLDYLRETSGEEVENRVIALTPVNAVESLWAGVLLTIKNARRYAQLKRRRIGFEVTTQELAANTNIVEVNFFVINERTGRGLYQHYHHSAALTVFSAVFRRQFMTYKAIKEIERGRFKLHVLLREASLEDYIRQLASVKSIEFEAVSYRPDEHEFRALEDIAQRVRHRFVFFKKHQNIREAVKNRLIELVRAERFNMARIEGYDENGVEVLYQLANEPDTFAEYEYDDYINAIRLDTNDFDRTILESPCVQELIALYNQEGINELINVEGA